MTIGLTWRSTARRIKRLKEGVLAISPDYSDPPTPDFLALSFRSCHCDWSTAVIRSSRAQRAVAPGLYHARPTDNCVWIARKLIQFMNEPIDFSARSEVC